MEIIPGNLYFVSDDFFVKVNDPCLKINYKNTKRPHYYAYQDQKTTLYWLVPCSSKVSKYKKIIQQKEKKHIQTDTIKIVKIFNRQSVLLFQDMFPILPNYIENQYLKRNRPVHITNPKTVKELENTAQKIIDLLHKGIHFTPTQPNSIRIEKIMLQELKISQIQSNTLSLSNCKNINPY